MSDRRLLLFDIDGTLIASGGAGEWALRDAMKTRFGIEEDLGGILLAGATDKKIAVAMLEKNGLAPSPENITALLDEYLAHLETRIPKHNGRVLPGMIELLEILAKREEALLAQWFDDRPASSVQVVRKLRAAGWRGRRHPRTASASGCGRCWP